MKQEEKDIYALIFKVALTLSKVDRKYSRFAWSLFIGIAESKGDIDKMVFSYAWEMLKEYADITNTAKDEERWRVLVMEKVEDYGEGRNKGEQKLLSNVLAEIERRSRDNGNHVG